MSVRFITGKTGVGKTDKIISEVIHQSKMNSNTKHWLFIVPEQSTLNIQHELVRKHPDHCLSNIEILSFNRLGYRMSDSLGIAGKTIISDVGKNMLIRKIIMESKDNYPILSGHVNKTGYVNELRGLLAEFSRYALDDKAFESIISNVDDTLLKYKLTDCHKLYQAFQSSIKDTYFSGDTLLNLLLNKIETSAFLEASEIYLDGFYGFTPIQFAIIERLALTVKKLTINLTIDNELLNKGSLSEQHLYSESYETMNRLRQMVANHPALEVTYEPMDVQGNRTAREHLRDWLYQYPYHVYDKQISNYSIIKAPTMNQEVACIRNSILHMVRDKGYRFNDIAVLCGDVGRYRLKMETMFDMSEIPYYIDNKRTMLMNEAGSFLLSVVNLGRTNMSYNSVFTYLKSGFVDVDETLLDYLENYAFRYGIRGSSRWNKPFEYRIPDIDTDKDAPLMSTLLKAMNEERKRIIEPINKYLLSGAKTVREHIDALYQFITAIQLSEVIDNKKAYYENKGQLNRSREFGQLYNKMIDLLDELHEIGAEDKIDYQVFYELLEAGLEQTEIGNVPARMDEILIGDLTRSRLLGKKVLYIIGVNEGIVPLLNEGVSLFSDGDRDYLLNRGFELAPSAKKNLQRDQFYIYLKVLLKTDKTFMSFAMSNDEGKTARPAHLIYMMKKLCPNIQTFDAAKILEEGRGIYHPEISYRNTIVGLQSKKNSQVATMYQWYSGHKTYSGRIKKAIKGKAHSVTEDGLTKEITDKLYRDKLFNTVTRLEQYRRCPFAHFARYGLKAEERINYEITMPQLGLLFHRVIELFSKRVLNRGLSWEDISEQIRKSWIEELIESVLADEQHEVFYDNERNKHRIHRLSQMLNKSIEAIGYQITRGDFKPVSSEWQFMGEEEAVEALNLELENNKRMQLLGTIDRVDVAEYEGNKYLTIVDYKSGNQQFDMNEIYNGLQLQLMVYLNAATELKSKDEGAVVQPAGVFYLKINDPFIAGDRFDENDDEAIMKQFKLRGVVLEDETVIKMLDKYFVKDSPVIPVKRNRDGTLSKQSKVLNKETLDTVREYVTFETTRLGNAIVNGTITPKPIKHGEKTACTHCLYKSVCGFDDKLMDCHYDIIEALPEEEIIANMKTKVSGAGST